MRFLQLLLAPPVWPSPLAEEGAGRFKATTGQAQPQASTCQWPASEATFVLSETIWQLQIPSPSQNGALRLVSLGVGLTRPAEALQIAPVHPSGQLPAGFEGASCAQVMRGGSSQSSTGVGAFARCCCLGR